MLKQFLNLIWADLGFFTDSSWCENVNERSYDPDTAGFMPDITASPSLYHSPCMAGDKLSAADLGTERVACLSLPVTPDHACALPDEGSVKHWGDMISGEDGFEGCMVVEEMGGSSMVVARGAGKGMLPSTLQATIQKEMVVNLQRQDPASQYNIETKSTEQGGYDTIRRWSTKFDPCAVCQVVADLA